MDRMQQRLLTALVAACPRCSQAEIARRVGFTPQRLSQYLTGLRSMDTDAVLAVAAYVGMDPDLAVSTHHAETARTDRERRYWRGRSGGRVAGTGRRPALASARAEQQRVVR